MPNSGNQTFIGGLNSAILRYVGAPIADPVTNSTSSNPLVETNLHPLVNATAPGIPTPGAADVNINLDIVFNTGNLTFTVNGATFVPPTVPVLMQIISGAMTPQSLLPPGSVYVLPPNKVIEISIPGGSIGSPVSVFLHNHVTRCSLTVCSSIPYIFMEWVFKSEHREILLMCAARILCRPKCREHRI